MRKTLFLAVALFATAPGFVHAAVVFTENVGTPSGTTAIGTYAGWQNNGTLAYTGTGDVRNTTVSSGYTGASGGGNVFLTNTSAGFTFQIANIDTSTYTGTFDLNFGAFKSVATTPITSLLLEYSPDGSTYTAIPGTTLTGGASWRLISLTGITLPTVSNLRLRWTDTSTASQFRVDDVTLSGVVAIPEASSFLFGGMICGVIGLWSLRNRRMSEQRLA